MPPHFSVRDITFTPTAEGVRIVLTTDIPCHLYLRLTEELPRIHKEAVLRRGLRLNDDVRFCFTVYEDNQQDEPGDTLTHTFWKPHWPPGTTKYVYAWGYVDGQVAVSTTPFFEYQNTGEAPIPVPDKLMTCNSITPQRFDGRGTMDWVTYSLAGIVSPQATGAILTVVNSDTGAERAFGCRPKGSSGFSSGFLRRNGMTGAIVGLDQNLEFEALVGYPGRVYFYVMGYTGRNVHFFDEPVVFPRDVPNIWYKQTTAEYAPGAKACIWDIGANAGTAAAYKIRVFGSDDDLWNGGFHAYPILGVDDEGYTEDYPSTTFITAGHIHLIGYIDSNFEKHLNAKGVSPGVADTWVRCSVEDIVEDPPWVVIQEYWGSGAHSYGMRKSRTWWDEKRQTAGGEWQLVHADPDGYCDLWAPSAGQNLLLHGEITGAIV